MCQLGRGDELYFHMDGLGSTRVLTNPSGSSSDEYAYTAFGEVLMETGSTDTNYLYTGEHVSCGIEAVLFASEVLQFWCWSI